MLLELEPDMATLRTVDPTHRRNLKVMAPIERQASEAKPTIEYTSSTSPIASSAHQMSEPLAQAGSVAPLDELKNRASDGLRDNEASSMEAHKAMPSSKLRENDSTKPTEPGKEEQDQVCPALSTSQK